MGRLRHRTAPGWTYFVTTKTWQNRALFYVRKIAEIVAEKIISYRDQGAYLLHEFVIMPNHVHLILTPADSTSLERAMQFIKGGSSHEIHARRGHTMRIWQPGFHESTVRDSADYASRARYIRLNPVVEKLVERPEQWLFGSASGKYQLDPIPQGLKPLLQGRAAVVGAEAPTPSRKIR